MNLRTITSGVLTGPSGVVLAYVKVDFLLVDASNKMATDAWDCISRERISGDFSRITNSEGKLADENDNPIVHLWPNDRGNPATMYKISVNYPGIRTFYAAVPSGTDPLDWLDLYSMGKSLQPATLPLMQQMLSRGPQFVAILDHLTISTSGQPLWDGQPLGTGSPTPTASNSVTADLSNGLNYRIDIDGGVLATVELAAGTGSPVQIIVADTSNGLLYQITTMNGGLATVELPTGASAQNNIIYDATSGKSYRIITIDGAITTEEL
jgi:hypothetical protein